MPRVPEYGNGAPTVDAANLPNVRQDTPDGLVRLASAASEAQMRTGNQMQRTGAEMTSLFAQEQLDANRVRVVDAQNAAMRTANDLRYGDGQNTQGFLGLKGDAALSRPNGVALPDEYGQKLQQSIDEIKANLGNDAQRQAFDMWAKNYHASFQGDVQRHMLSELQDYKLTTYDGAAKLALDQAKLNWNDPVKVRDAIDGTPDPANPEQRYGGLKFAAYQYGKAKGWAPPEVEAFVKAQVSQAHYGVVQAAIENNNPTYANQYMQANKGAMTADDILRANGSVNRSLDSHIALSAVQATAADLGSRFQPTDFDRLKGIVMQQESGGRDYDKNGNVLTSTAGAKGKMQVVDSTNTAPGFGVRPAQDDSLAERARVGRDYLQAMAQRYGNAAMTMAAYNAGPGALDAALDKAKKDGNPSNWLAYLPKETQAYVQNGMARFNSGQGAAPKPSLLEFVDNAVKRLGADPRPEQVQLVRQQAEHQYRLTEQSLKDQGDDALLRAQKALIANGGDIHALDPQLTTAVINAGKYDDMLKFNKAVNSPDAGQVSRPEVWYNITSHFGDGSDKDITRMSEADFYQMRPYLSETDFRHFAQERANTINGKPGERNAPGNLNIAGYRDALNARLNAIGIATTGSKVDKAQLGAVQQFAAQWVLADQAAAGHRFNQEETARSLDRLFAQNVNFRTSLLGIPTGTSSLRLLSMKASDIPKDAYEGIKSDLKLASNAEPTDQDILLQYWKLHGKRR